jgi:hypothetical protein
MVSQRTIKIKKYQDINNEYSAGGAIKPGSLLALNSDDEVVVHATAAGAWSGMVALEDELQGRSTRDDYVAGDPVQAWSVQLGEEVLLLVDAAFDPDIGAFLETSTAGQVRAVTTGVAIFQVIGPKFVDDDNNHRVPARRV